MTKMWRKKGEILKLLKKRPMTISEMSRELGLAVSTTSQHVSELRDINAVIETNIGHSKKWRYYKINPEFRDEDATKLGGRSGLAKKVTVVGGIAVGALLITLFYFATTSQANNAILFSLTDPPVVPNGTQALMVNYSSLEIHVTGPNNTTRWISGYGNGTVNLLNLINVSQTIGKATVTGGGRADQLRFNINSAHIVINGTTYSVFVPHSQVVADIMTPPGKGNPSEVLIDLFPTIVEAYNGKSENFSLLVDVRAIARPHAGAIRIGMMGRLGHNESMAFRNVSTSLSISNQTVMDRNNSLRIYLDIANTGNRSVIIKHIIVVGKKNVTLVGNRSWVLPPPPAGPFGWTANRYGSPPINCPGILPPPCFTGFDRSRLLDFVVESNGTVVIQHMEEQEFNSGYILAPNASRAFAFGGNLTFVNGTILATFLPGTDYKIAVIGNDNVFAIANVTAT